MIYLFSLSYLTLLTTYCVISKRNTSIESSHIKFETSKISHHKKTDCTAASC